MPFSSLTNFASEDSPNPTKAIKPTFLPLRRLTRYRFHFIQAINREKAYFTTHLYLKFSALSFEKSFVSLFGATSVPPEGEPTQSEVLITEFFPDELVHLLLKELTLFNIKNGKNRFKNPEKIIEAIQRIGIESYRLLDPLCLPLST